LTKPRKSKHLINIYREVDELNRNALYDVVEKLGALTTKLSEEEM
jgi:hypothetical protein